MTVYLDHNATAPLHPVALNAMLAALAVTGNPASVHGSGRAVRAILEDAREAVAALVGAAARTVVFTSGGTEALALAIGGLSAESGSLLVSAGEHAAVLAAVGERAEVWPLLADGTVDLDWLTHRLRQSPPPALVALQRANNETGVIQPVAAVARMLKPLGVCLVCDAVQAAGKIPLSLDDLQADAVVISGHKLGATAGIGALVMTDQAAGLLRPLIVGGGQERGRRGGTPNWVGAAGFGAVARHFLTPLDHTRGLRDTLEAGLLGLAPQALIHGRSAPERLPNTTCVSLPGISQGRAIMALDLDGIAVSAGAACSSGKVAISHVLTAMGVPPVTNREAIRVSLGWNSTAHDVTAFLAAWAKLVP